MSPATAHRSGESGFTLVELLVVIMLLGVIGATTTGILISTLRTESYQSEMQAVMDDGRISLQRIRKEVRAARQVYDTSCRNATVCAPSPRLHFWVDQNQDLARTSDEIVCYLTESIGPAQFQLVRWTGTASGCTAATRPANVQVLARTLVPTVDTNSDGTPDLAAPFVEFSPEPTSDPVDPPTRNLRVLLDLEVQAGRDSNHLQVESIIRLRNVA